MLGEYQLHGIILSKRRIIGKEYYSPVKKAFDRFIQSRRCNSVAPRIKVDKTSRILSAYSKEEVQKMLDSFDRGNPKGKRDFAILLLASRLVMNLWLN